MWCVGAGWVCEATVCRLGSRQAAGAALSAGPCRLHARLPSCLAALLLQVQPEAHARAPHDPCAPPGDGDAHAAGGKEGSGQADGGWATGAGAAALLCATLCVLLAQQQEAPGSVSAGSSVSAASTAGDAGEGALEVAVEEGGSEGAGLWMRRGPRPAFDPSAQEPSPAAYAAPPQQQRPAGAAAAGGAGQQQQAPAAAAEAEGLIEDEAEG